MGDGVDVQYVFPNDTTFWWSLPIVAYPFTTGLIAGACLVACLHQVFRVKAFAPVSRLGLIAGFFFTLFAPLPLLMHLGHPERAFHALLTPRISSPMSLFGLLYASYFVVLSMKVWLTYREYFVLRATSPDAHAKWLWRALALGVTNHSHESVLADRKTTYVLSWFGMPIAVALHCYVGYIFGSVEANPWWNNPVQPLGFLVSALVAGVAAIHVLYSIDRWHLKKPFNLAMVRSMMRFLWFLMLLDLVTKIAHIGFSISDSSWPIERALMMGPLFPTLVVAQLILFFAVPWLTLGVVVFFSSWTRRHLWIVHTCSVLVLLEVLVMRFNVIIGGEMLSKSSRGFVHFDWPWFGQDGVLVTLVLLALPWGATLAARWWVPVADDDPRAGPLLYSATLSLRPPPES